MVERRIFKLIALGLAFSFACLSAACRPDYEVPPDTLRQVLGAEPSTLNPILASDAYSGEINGYVFDSLMETDLDTLEYKPKMAERWEISEDRKTYTFYLRKDVRWHDGVPFTADDVVFTFNAIKDPKTNAAVMQVYYQDVERVEKIDDHTVKFVYSKVYFKGLSVCGFIPLVPKHILEGADMEHHRFSRSPVGLGPYRFKSWDTNKKIVLVRNEDYWGEKPEIKRVEYLLVGDSSMALQLLKKGLIDVYEMRAIEWVRQTGSAKFGENFYKLSYPGRGYSYIGWNAKGAYFSDKRVRRAMTLLIDLEKIKNKIQFGLANFVTGPFFPFSKQNDPGVKPLAHDVAGAKRLLAEAGWVDTNGDGWLDKDGKRFSFSYLYPSASKFSERLGTILKEEAKRVGIDVKIARLEWAAFLERTKKRDFDAVSLAWGMPFESDPYQLWHSSQADIEGSSNYVSYANPEADKLIEAARVEFDEEKRNGYYHRFQRILYDEQPYTFMLANPILVAVSKRFDNVVVHKAGLNPLEWKVRE